MGLQSSDFADRLNQLRLQSLERSLTPVSGTGTTIDLNGAQVVSFCSNDYLGLSRHPAVIEACKDAADTYGCSAGSSRLIAGDHPLLRSFEEELADFVGTEAALLVGSGFAANLAVLSSLPKREETIFSDALNHASIIDGARLSRANIRVLPHADLSEAANAFSTLGRGWYVTESVFSMNGDTPNLPGVLEAASQNGVGTIVDEAHALGVVGPSGRGLCHDLPSELRPDVLIGTLGKSFGSYGAFIAGSRELRSLLINIGRSIVFSTAPAPPAVAAARMALSISLEDDSLRKSLLSHSKKLRGMLSELGYDTLNAQAHIVPVILGDPAGAVALADLLLERGIFVRAIRPPTVPNNTSRLRLTLSALHTDEQIETLIEALDAGCRQLGLGPYDGAL